MVDIRRPLDGVGRGELGQPPLGELEILPVVENVQEPVFQFVRMLPPVPPGIG